tara:strand:+ start:1342 stop:2361 length:1020 start_codon:yes stop_codon:yes gene_type:complete
METNNIHKSINNLKDACFKYYYSVNSNEKGKEIINIKKIHKKCLNYLLVLKNEGEFYDRFIIQMIYVMMIFTIYTRDKYYGMGSYELFEIQFHNYVSYMDKGVIHKKNIYTLLLNIIKRQENEENIGCWKDLKCLANYLSYCGINRNHEVMNMIYKIFSKQIIHDIVLYNNFTNENYKNISWCAKWIPREKSCYGWMVPYIMQHMFELNTQISPSIYYSYLKKYRKTITKLNKKLDTAEIYICKNEWSKIDFKNKSANFIKKYMNNFTKLRSIYDSDDRKECIKDFDKFKKINLKRIIEKEHYIEGFYFPNYKSIKLLNIVNDLHTNKRYLIPFINYNF